MKICLYSPYVPKHTGGGEKYFFDTARLLAEQHDVFIAVPQTYLHEFEDKNPSYHFDKDHTDRDAIERDELLSIYFQQVIGSFIRAKYEAFLGTSLRQVHFLNSPLGTDITWWKKLWWTKQFDVMYYVTDGSFFFSLARKNIVHIQFPFTHRMDGLLNRLKLVNWSVKNTNSVFTQNVIEKHWRVKAEYVHYPMVDTPQLPSGLLQGKHKIILHVGRFFQQLHAKRQDVLIEMFRSMMKDRAKEMTGWQLLLIGSTEDQTYVEELHRKAKGLPITFIHTADRKELLKLYERASIYWHATGYQIDEARHPEKVEHFGISTIEAMSYGCVPVVLGKGGQKEILEEFPDLLWQASEEGVAKTLSVVRGVHTPTIQNLRERLRERARDFAEARFRGTLLKMVGSK